MTKLLLGLLMVFGLAGLLADPASALGLKVAPLEYRTTLEENEKKQGFIDISNPAAQPITVKVSVQAFRQLDDSGSLQFYDDEQIARAITPELTTFELGSRQSLRLFFTANGPALPEGDVFAAIFFTTTPKQSVNGVGQLVRVGTILSIINKNPGSRSAAITKLQVPMFQLSDTVHGSYGIKNTGPKDSGFYPTVKVTAWPGGAPKQVQSSLVFGGRERMNDMTYRTGYGIHRLSVSYGSSVQYRWVITLAPWMIIVAAMTLCIVGFEVFLLRRRRAKNTEPTTVKL